MASKPAFLAALLIGMAVGTPAFGGEEKNTRLEKLGEEYVAAQFAFDQEAIKRLTTPNFVEISPKGEIDERASVIAFYAPEKRTAAPPYKVGDSKVRVSGMSAVITQVVTIGIEPRAMSLSQSLAATRVGSKWLLASSQSTPQPRKTGEK